jgi:hypothetical protein
MPPPAPASTHGGKTWPEKNDERRLAFTRTEKLRDTHPDI